MGGADAFMPPTDRTLASGRTSPAGGHAVTPALALTSRAFAPDYTSSLEQAAARGYDGIDWNIDVTRIPVAPGARERYRSRVAATGLPIRFHGPTGDTELGHGDPRFGDVALQYLKMYVDVIAIFPGTHMTVHIGSRSIAVEDMAWGPAIDRLRELVAYGRQRGVRICLENLKRGWTSDPHTYREMLDRTGAWATFDTGHARASPWVQQEHGGVRDFLDVVADRVCNAHIYEIENEAGQHVPPADLRTLGPVLERLRETPCDWWVFELTDPASIERCRELTRPLWDR